MIRSNRCLLDNGRGTDSVNNRILGQGEPGMLDKLESNDLFGRALASGDFDNNGASDLAAGVPFETIDIAAQGAVHVIYSVNNDKIFTSRFECIGLTRIPVAFLSI